MSKGISNEKYKFKYKFHRCTHSQTHCYKGADLRSSVGGRMSPQSFQNFCYSRYILCIFYISILNLSPQINESCPLKFFFCSFYPSRTSGIFSAITRFQTFRFRLHEKGEEDHDKDDTFIKLTV